MAEHYVYEKCHSSTAAVGRAAAAGYVLAAVAAAAEAVLAQMAGIEGRAGGSNGRKGKPVGPVEALGRATTVRVPIADLHMVHIAVYPPRY